ncbi:hypothetical protein HY522_05205 [bacterium]|nr:hypothetical protein [bacterium]
MSLYTPLALAALILIAAPHAHAVDAQANLREADRFLRAQDTAAALKRVREVVEAAGVEEWLRVEAMKIFAERFTSPSDTPAAFVLFPHAMNASKSPTSISTLLALLMRYPPLSGEGRLQALAGLDPGRAWPAEVLETQIELLRNLGRHGPALEFAARLAQLSGRLDHRVMMVDLLLDLGRRAEAVSFANEILREHGADPGAYADLAERFYRHGDYRGALDIHRRARTTFSNPGLFFDQSLSICQGLQLGREGIELYLPVLLPGPAPAPEYFRDFLAMITDTVFLTRTYPELISEGKNPYLYESALFRFAEITSDADCLGFARTYVRKFQNAQAHLLLAEQLLIHERLPAFLQVLAEVPDTPPITAESKKLMLFRHALQTAGPEQALAKYPPKIFSNPAVRASAHRLSSEAYFREDRIAAAVAELRTARDISPTPADDLRLAQLLFLDGAESEALRAAHRAHAASPSDLSLYWLGWLSYIEGDTATARTALRDVVSRSETFLADESLAWLIAMARPDRDLPDRIGQSIRNASRGGVPPRPSDGAENFPVAAQIVLWTEALRSGRPEVAAGDIRAAGSPFLHYLRWESLPPASRSDAQYQKLLLQSPEYLRPLIRTEEP